MCYFAFPPAQGVLFQLLPILTSTWNDQHFYFSLYGGYRGISLWLYLHLPGSYLLECLPVGLSTITAPSLVTYWFKPSAH